MRRLRRHCLYAGAVCAQAQVAQQLATALAVLFEQDDQRLFARQDLLEQRHVATVQRDGLVLQQREQLLHRGDVLFDQLQQGGVVHG